MKSQRLLLSLVVFALCVCWSGVSNVSTSFAEETDPQVGNNTTGYIPKWDGSALVTGSIFDNGNIGVGTATPSSKFHVFTQSAGVGLFESNTTQAYLKILTNEGSNNRVEICNRTGGRMSFFTVAGGDVLNITRDGNVGIGTTIPNSKFHVLAQSAGVGLFESNTTQAYLKILTNEGSSNRVEICNRTGGRLSLFTAGGGDVLNITRDGNVGIGTTIPQSAYRFHVFAQNNGVGLFESNTTQAYLEFQTNEGTNNRVAICNRPGGRLSLFTAGGGDVLNITRDGNVGIGTTIPPVGHKLAVNGSIKAKQVVVETTGWSDFVFEKNYKLIPLEKLEESIEKNGHLPDIPSAKEVAEKGINIGEIQAKLLQKIEELTLHMIEQNKRMNSLEQENKVLRAQTSLLLRNGR